MMNGRIGTLAILITTFSTQGSADSIEDFYRGKQLSMTIATSAGNDYDFRARLLARHMPKYIPGNPQILSRNMPGGGGIVATNWFAKLAPRDGTSLMMIQSNMMSAQALGTQGVAFDARKFFWIGNTSQTPNVINSWHTAEVKSVEDAKTKELVLGGSIGSASAVYPVLINKLIGTKFKLVTGYPGGNELNLALERGEIQGRGSNSWASWKSTRPQWLADKKLIIIVQVALQRAADLPDVPTMIELAQNDLDKEVARFISADTAVARAVVVTEETPPERIQSLRRAFDATVKDSEFLAEAAKTQMDISPLSGEESQKIAESIVNTRPEVIARARELLGDMLK